MSHTAAPKVAFIFDCDGTLVNSTPVWAYAQPELLHRHGIDVTVDDFAQFEHLSLEDECQAYHDTWGIGTNGEELYRELSDILINGYSKVPPRDGLLAFLKQAQEAGIAMCVATSTPAELVQSALAGAGLDAYMEFVTTTGEAGRAKQFPDVYELALRRLEERHGHKFERAWVFEDAVFGLKSSGSAGFKRVGIFDPHGRMKRDDVIRLSLRFLGMEVGIMEFTPQDGLLVDRFHKQYVRASYHEVSFLKQANLDFYALQSLFWNELFVPGTRDVKSCMNRFNLFKANGYTILSPTNTPKLTYSFLTHANRALIEQVRVQGRKATDKGEFCWTYANFSAFGTRQFPHSMEMNVTGTGRDIKLSLDLSALSADSNWNTRTTISSKYQRRTVDEVLSGLKL